METIEDLVVGVEGGSHIRVGEPFVEGEMDGREKRSPRRAPLRLCQLPEDVAQTLLLLFAVGQHIDALPVGDQRPECRKHLFELLVKEWLRLGVKHHRRHDFSARSLRLVRRFRPLPIHAAHQLRLQLLTIHQQARSRKTGIDFRQFHLRSGGLFSQSLIGKPLVENLLHAVAHKLEIVCHNHRLLREVIGDRYQLFAARIAFDVRHDLRALHRRTRQLGLHLKRMHALHFVAEKVDAIGIL